MDVTTRMQRIRILQKMEQAPEYSEKLGIRDGSVWKREVPHPAYHRPAGAGMRMQGRA